MSLVAEVVVETIRSKFKAELEGVEGWVAGSEFFELVDYRPDLDGSPKTLPLSFYSLQPQKHFTE